MDIAGLIGFTIEKNRIDQYPGHMTYTETPAYTKSHFQFKIQIFFCFIIIIDVVYKTLIMIMLQGKFESFRHDMLQGCRVFRD